MLYISAVDERKHQALRNTKVILSWYATRNSFEKENNQKNAESPVEPKTKSRLGYELRAFLYNGHKPQRQVK
jgi:hypothetical protein